GAEGELPKLYAFARSSLMAKLNEPSEHLSYERAVAYVDDELKAADKSEIEEHLGSCSDCQVSVQELRELKASCDFSSEMSPGASTSGTRREPWSEQNLGPRTNLLTIGLAAAALLAIVVGFVYTFVALRHAQEEIALTQEILRQRDSVIADLQTQLSGLQ